jgi:hypothetical protein
MATADKDQAIIDYIQLYQVEGRPIFNRFLNFVGRKSLILRELILMPFEVLGLCKVEIQQCDLDIFIDKYSISQEIDHATTKRANGQ